MRVHLTQDQVSTTDPSVLDPSVVDPSVLDPSVLDPSVVDPSVLDPSVVVPGLDSLDGVRKKSLKGGSLWKIGLFMVIGLDSDPLGMLDGCLKSTVTSL